VIFYTNYVSFYEAKILRIVLDSTIAYYIDREVKYGETWRSVHVLLGLTVYVGGGLLHIYTNVIQVFHIRIRIRIRV
jgi:hypothetical protein